MRYLISTLLFALFSSPVLGESISLRVLAWNHGISPVALEAASMSSGAVFNVDLYETREELTFYLTQHKTKPYDILLLPEQSVRKLLHEGTFLPLGVGVEKPSLNETSPVNAYAALAVRDHLAASVKEGGAGAASWADFFMLAKQHGSIIGVDHFSDAIDGLLIANEVSPSRYGEGDLMQISTQIPDYQWVQGQHADINIISYAKAVNDSLAAYFPGGITRKTDYFFTVSSMTKHAQKSWSVVQTLLKRSSLAPLRYDGVSVYFDGEVHPPSKAVDELAVVYGGAHASQRMVKLKTIMESVLHVSKR